MKQKIGRKLLSFLLTLAMVVGLMPGMSLTAYADGTTYNPASTYTGFGDLNTNNTEVTISEVSEKTWYVIANDSTTVTLLSKQSFGNHAFNSNDSAGNVYANSEIKSYVEGLTGEGQPLAGISSVISDLTLIDTATAQGLSETKRKGAGGYWWLRSPSTDMMAPYYAAYVNGGTGEVFEYGGGVASKIGVRPALKLDLSKVTFDSATNTFALLPTPYPLWVGGVQVTSANKEDVLGDTDEGATVVFTPAVDDNAATTDVNESSPATLTLNGADISGGNNDSEYAAIYADGFDLTINVTENSTVTGPETNDYDNSTGIKIHEGCLTITGSGRLTTTGGESANGASYGIDVDSAVTINGPLNASGGETQGAESCGIYARNGITVSSSGTLAASGGTGEAGSYGIWASVTVDGSLSAIGNSQAIYGTVKNSIAGTGWTDTEGTTGKASIAVSEAGRELNSYKKVQFPAYTVTYKVVNGTWSDDSTTDKTEDVPAGSKPSSVPTGMKASEGYMGGAWDTNPADLTITEAKTFTYTFTAKSDQTAPTGLTATKASSNTATDGKISGVTAAMEYQIDGASTWTAVGENKTEITGLTAGTYKVRYAETADKNASPETSVEVGVKVAPTVTAPTAKTLTYNGQAQELVTAGSTDGGEMQYALGTATEVTGQYTASIPTKTNAGTYYVWYKVVGDENHVDTEPEVLKVTIDVAKGETKIETEVQTDDKSPKLEASNLTKDVAESTLTDKEKEIIDEAVNSGKDVDVDVYLAIRDIADEITAEDKAKLEAKASDAGQLAYFDISLFKEIIVDGYSQGATSIHELATPLKLTIGVPKSFPAVADGYTRTYVVLRLHDGVVTVLPATVNADGTISFETDRLSTYAVAYTDSAIEEEVETVDMYRIYNPNSGEHFYTANVAEKDKLVKLGWRYEGIGWKAPVKSNTPVYRLYNPNAGDHHYTRSIDERDYLVSLGWKYEGIGWYSDDAESVPLYRQYNPNAKAGNHNYTASKSENDWLVGLGWRYEGIGWYGVK